MPTVTCNYCGWSQLATIPLCEVCNRPPQSEEPVEHCKHPFVWPDGDCVECGVLATVFPGNMEPVHTMVPRKFQPLFERLQSHKDRLTLIIERLKSEQEG